jgi:DMSO/TMAO reductase YedYZ molybdopterin-dependent catalytic subunit
MIAGGTLGAGFDRLAWPIASLANEADPFRGGQKLGVVDFVGELPIDLNAVIGAELDGRLYTDLSTLTPKHPLTPTKNFYLRTCASKLLKSDTPWTVRISGLVRAPAQLSSIRLRKMEKSMGIHLMECAGNTRAFHFGLMSAASWTGVPMTEILNAVQLKPQATHVLVSGFDRYETKSSSSIPGASWIFKLDELTARGAFLATQMNGDLLPRDHGAPVRLVVPGWYGCTCIKWVNEISVVSADARATSQMKEYAARTQQPGVPELARDYLPAVMEHAAIPIRIERWLVDATIRYRVLGILWGGSKPVKRLEIRFNPEQEYVPVSHLEQSGEDSWSFWTHVWEPQKHGTYLIRLRVADPIVPTKRLDAGYYLRAVEI